jgi:hypothetical protein
MQNFFRGDTNLVPFTFISPSTAIAEDITDWIFYVTMKLDPDISDTASGVVQVKVDLSIADPLGLIYRELDAPAGKVKVRFGPEKTIRLIPSETYYWDVQRSIPIVNGGGELVDHDVITLQSGTVVVLADVTNTFRQGDLVEQ